MSRLGLAAIVALFCTVTVTAKNGAFRSTRHGDPVKGPQRKADHPAGSCVQCHDGHARHDPPGPSGDSSELCLDCHTLAPLDGGSFPGVAAWTAGAHARERMERPDDPAVQSRNACVACHDPHGVRDARGVIPALLAQRERDLCLGCHDGVRGADVRNELQKTYWHGQNARGEHDPAEARNRDPIDSAPLNRHVTCSDCHNAHVARADRGEKYDGEASDRLAGVARVQVVHGAAGTQPSYRWLAPNDPAPAYEFEICFKCHSSAVRQLPQSEDLARTTNPANPSFHPIQARGRNRNIDANAFAGGMSAESRIRCSDCHSGETSRVRGPHGSSHEHLLRRRYASDGSLPMARTDLCFDCHAWAVYADAASDAALLAASRFNAPSGAGHAFHTGAQRIHCSACHEPHGSMRQPALLAVRQRPGITSYIQTPSGGTCTPTCHVTRSYQVSYPR